VKLLATSDWHGDWTTRGISRFDEVECAAHHTVATAMEQNVDAYLFLGDLCDPDSGSSVFRVVALAVEVARRLADAGIPSVWLAGNHDVIEDGSGQTTLTPLRALAHGLVHVVEHPGVVKRAGHPHIACLPFTASSHGYDTAGEAARLIGGQTDAIVVSHLTVPGMQPGEETTEMPRGREVLYPFEATRRVSVRLSGHYHRRQSFVPKDGGPPIEVVGSLARLTFAEEKNEPRFLLIEV
jgi:DNA repair exonuclease SbcCD nuclease subunit